MSLLDNLKSFGQDSAESETESLQNVFLSTPFYQHLKDKDLQKWLILGRKGAGKTAACLMLAQQLPPQNKTIQLSPRDLIADKFIALDNTSINANEAALLKWQHILTLKLSKYVVDTAKQKLGRNYFRWPKSIRKVRSFLIRQDDTEANSFNKTVNYFRSMTEFAISSIVSIKRNSVTSESLGDDIEKILPAIQEAGKTILKDPLYVLIDHIDQHWDSTQDGENLIIGLLRAAKKTNDYFKIIKMIVFLRSDIFSYLRFNDADKYRSHIELITWDKHNLKELIALRIKDSTNLQGDAEELWKSVFPYEIGGEDSFEDLVSYTFMKPRDLIQLCNICRDKAAYRGGENIISQDIENAISQYSQWKLQDLFTEYSIQYPFLEELLTNLFYYHSSHRIDRKDIEELFEPDKSDFIDKYGKKYFEPFDVLLQILYTVNFLGIVHNGRTLYESLGDKFLTHYAKHFEIHRAFRKGLNIPEKKEEGQVITSNIAGNISNIHISGDVSGSVFIKSSKEAKVNVLFLAANPVDQFQLRLDEEVRTITEASHRTAFRDKFYFQTSWVTRAVDLQNAILRYKPNIIHFSGHGSKISQLVLEDNSGNMRSIDSEALSQLLKIVKGDIRCVVLNACYSETQAKAIAENIDYVIGTSQLMGSSSSISFAAAFYQALAYGKDVKTAFELGCIQIEMETESLDVKDMPVLLTSKDASTDIFTE